MLFLYIFFAGLFLIHVARQEIGEKLNTGSDFDRIDTTENLVQVISFVGSSRDIHFTQDTVY